MNTLEYAVIFQEELDKAMVAGATSGWMEENTGDIEYNGGNEIKVPIIDMDGLADYDRSEGFKKGAVSLKYKTMGMTQDRGRSFLLDSMDVNETNFVACAGNVMGEFQATKVVPEIDAYRYSKIAAIAEGYSRVTQGFIPTSANILKQLREDIYKIYDDVGDGINLVISINTLVAQILENSTEIQKQLGVADFKKGEINLQVKTLDNIPLIKVPSARMFTEYLFRDGSSGQEEGGFEKTEAAKSINWQITGQKVPKAVSKTDKIRIFTPDENQTADAWKLDLRKYHELWILSNKVKAVWVNTQ